MRRREFTILLGSAALTLPRLASAQQARVPEIGVLYLGRLESQRDLILAFHKGLSETGYIEGRNVEILYRSANNEVDRLPELAADLVRRKVAVIVAPGAMIGAMTARKVTATIPIVFQGAGDAVALGLAASLKRPGGNVTGFTSLSVDVLAKRIGILHSLLPRAQRFAALVHPRGSSAESIVRDLQAAGAGIGRPIEILMASSVEEIDRAFEILSQNRADALVTTPHPLFNNHLVQIVERAARHRVPAIYHLREFAEAGGLISYDAQQLDQYHQLGIYTGRILKGEKPSELPVMQPSRFELTINLKTARILDLEIPPTLLAVADAVIE
jgi:putative tryptophan/tyrosine transport system substrate-binding protein